MNPRFAESLLDAAARLAFLVAIVGAWFYACAYLNPGTSR
jgi:hypothetical protein